MKGKQSHSTLQQRQQKKQRDIYSRIYNLNARTTTKEQDEKRKEMAEINREKNTSTCLYFFRCCISSIKKISCEQSTKWSKRRQRRRRQRFFPTFCWQKNEGNNSYTTTKNSSPLKGAVVWIRSLSKPAAISSFRKMFPMEEALFPAMRQGKLKWIDCLWLWYGLTDVALRPFYSQAGFSFRNNLVQIWAMVFHSIHVQTKAFPKTHCHKKIWVRIGLFPLPFVSYTEMRKFTHPFHFPISFSLSLSSSLCIVNSWVGRKASSKKTISSERQTVATYINCTKLKKSELEMRERV